MLLHHQFVYIAKEFGNKFAILDRTIKKEISYSRALIASLILAKKFRKYPKGFLGIMLPTSAGAAFSIIGTLMSGRTPVLINYSTGAEGNAKFAQTKCNFKVIITSKALLEKIQCPSIAGMVFIEDIMENLSAADKLLAALKSKLPTNLLLKLIKGKDENESSVILFTSGSEKEPKAVQLSHRNIITNIQGFSDTIGLSDQDSVLANLPYFHVFGLTTNLWTPLYHGMTLITYANPLDYKIVTNIIREDKPSMVVGTPAFFWGYLNRSKPGDFESVRIAVSGADKCPDALREGYFKKHNLVLYEGYGATETSPVISTNFPNANKPGSVGKPIPCIHIKIENYENGEECAIGEIGKILVYGECVMKGYFDDLEETSLRVRSGWYDTGDMGYLDEDGYLWHAGRLKRFVKIGGEMVSLVRVENVLEKFLPVETSCCVVEIPNISKGADIIAVLTEDIDEKGVLKKMSQDLPNIALPKKFVVLDELPKMGSGKIDFRSTTEIVRNKLSGVNEANNPM